MLGRTHSLMGALGGVVTVDVVGTAPAMQVGWVAVSAGAALLPDLDMSTSTIGRLWGPLTGGLRIRILGRKRKILPGFADLVHAVAGGHRQGTHSIIGLLVVLVGVWAAQFNPYATAFVAALATGLAILAADFVIPGRIGWKTNALICSAVAIVCWQQQWQLPGWLPWAMAFGAAVHCLGDEMTKERVRWGWPFKPSGQRGRRPPRASWWRFRTGGTVEHLLLVLVIVPALVLVVMYRGGYHPIGAVATALISAWGN